MGKTGLTGFLHQWHVPGFDTPACDCGYHCKTVLHTLTQCPKWEQQWSHLHHQGQLDQQWLLNTPQEARALISWWIQEGILPQFSLAQWLDTCRP